MSEKRERISCFRATLAAALLALGVPCGFIVWLFAMFTAPYLHITVPVIFAVLLLLLILWTAGAARTRWFKYMLALGCAVVLCCGAYIGLGAYEDSLPTVDDRSLMLSDYRPFGGKKTTALPEPATMRFTEEQAASFTMDGATALYPVYAAFVQAVYPEGEYNWFSLDIYDDATALCNGTTEAYERLINGETDVIFVAEPSVQQQYAAENAGMQLHLTPIGREAFVFFVNSKNPVTGLTFEQVAGIYSGEITSWKDVGGSWQSIRAYQRPEGSGSQTGLQKLMRMADKPIMEPRMEDVAGGMGDIITRVAAYRNHRNAIGYTYRFYANEMVANDQIRLLSLNGVTPTKETIRDGSYPMASFFYAVTASPIGEPAPEETNAALGAFLDWCRSPQGQWLVEAVGYVGVE